MLSYLQRFNPTPAFPQYPGPYDVGSIDVEIPTTNFVASGLSPPPPSHATDIQTVQFRIFYPAAQKGDVQKIENASSIAPVRWLPSPRREYIAAYARFLGANPFIANILSYFPRILYYINIPVYSNVKLLQPGNVGESDLNLPEKLPTMIFSHGLGGTRHAYSHLLGSIASQGVVVFSMEHRDGSAPTTFITRSEDNNEIQQKIQAEGIPQTPSSSATSVDDQDEESEASKSYVKRKEVAELKQKLTHHHHHHHHPKSSFMKRIDYVSHPHEITDSTASLRNDQFEIRFWELGMAFAAAQKLNEGWSLDSNSTIKTDPNLFQMFKGRLDVQRPGSVVWAGHSFGAATVAQFVKSVWYHPKDTTTVQDESTKSDALYNPTPKLLSHFHPKDKSLERPPLTIVLDLWTLPLLGARTRPLWRLPLPGPTLGVLSQEFFVWKDNLRGNRHVLSVTGGGKNGLFAHGDIKGEANIEKTDDTSSLELTKSNSMDLTAEIPGGLVGDEDSKAAAKAGEEEETSTNRSTEASSTDPNRRFFYVERSAHMAQSDFNILFPRATKTTDDPERALNLNSRAILEFMRENGFNVAPFKGKDEERDTTIFGGDGKEDRWLNVSLSLDDGAKKKTEVQSSTLGTKDDLKAQL